MDAAAPEMVVKMSEEPVTVKPYETVKSAGKATRQTLLSVGAIVGTVILAALSEPAVLAQIGEAVKDHPWLPLAFLLLRMGLGVWSDRKKHKVGDLYVEPAGGALNPVVADMIREKARQ